MHEALAARVSALEAEVRRERARRRAVWLLPAVLLVIAAADAPESVRLRRLEIVDANGVTAALLQGHAMGGGVMSLYDRQGNALVSLGAADGGGMVIRDPTGRELLRLATNTEGRGVLAVYNASGRAVVQITSDAEERGFVAAFDERGFGKTLQPRPTTALGIQDR